MRPFTEDFLMKMPLQERCERIVDAVLIRLTPMGVNRISTQSSYGILSPIRGKRSHDERTTA
jgi:hypothetical protein